MGNVRMTELVRQYGPERIIADSARDWGVSDALALPKTARLVIERGISADATRKVSYDNALAIYGLNGEMKASDWLEPVAITSARFIPATASCAAAKPRGLRSSQRPGPSSRSPKIDMRPETGFLGRYNRLGVRSFWQPRCWPRRLKNLVEIERLVSREAFWREPTELGVRI